MLMKLHTTDISNKDVDSSSESSKQKFNFPQYGLTVEAVNLEEAEKELHKLINN